MLLDDPPSSTRGVPILVTENQYPCFRLLRIVPLRKNSHLNPAVRRGTGMPRQLPTSCLTPISQMPLVSKTACKSLAQLCYRNTLSTISTPNFSFALLMRVRIC